MPVPSSWAKMNKARAESAGREAETAALKMLVAAGWRLLAQRYQTGRGTGAGEVDIIAVKDRVVAFIEVKARPSLSAALESVTPRQQKRLARGAEAWLAMNPAYGDCDCRFDVVAVVADLPPQHFPDAWRPEF